MTGNYWEYPTGSDSKPSNKLTPDEGNNANFWDDGYTIGSEYWMTEVGAFKNSDSAYGTFDQGGNVLEWNEAVISNELRGFRGGSWVGNFGILRASTHNYAAPTGESFGIGFRVATVPEPSSIALMLCGALAGLWWWRRRK